MDSYRVIKFPYISEKCHDYASDLNTFTFVVDSEATKDDIRAALKAIWQVTPVSVRTLKTNPQRRRRGAKVGYTKPVKKALVRLPEGQTISVLK
jgi:large subunit ribosomal protein L23